MEGGTTRIMARTACLVNARASFQRLAMRTAIQLSKRSDGHANLQRLEVRHRHVRRATAIPQLLQQRQISVQVVPLANRQI